MTLNKNILIAGLTLFIIGVSNFAFSQDDCSASDGYGQKRATAEKTIVKKVEFKQLPESGKKCWISDSSYFVYKFAERPKLGTVVLKIQVFDKTGKQVSNFKVTGNSGMPAMRGAHDSGPVKFQLNKKGDYLLPVNIVMAGGWEVQLVFYHNEKEVYRGSFDFEI